MAIKPNPRDEAFLKFYLNKAKNTSPWNDKFALKIQNLHKSKNETFYFVNQKTLTNPGFPCMTKMNNYDTG